MSPTQKLKHNRYVKRAYAIVSRSLYFPPLVVLLAILIITIWPWQNARQTLHTNASDSISTKTNELQGDFTRKFTNYTSRLQSGVSLLQSEPGLTKQQWHTFFKTFEDRTDNQGIQGTGYSKVFSKEQASDISSFMSKQGISDFQYKPDSPRGSLNSAVLYLYPQTNNNQNVIGFDMLSEPSRREAMLRARDTGEPTLTKKVRLVQGKKEGDGSGFLLYIPYYKTGVSNMSEAERRSNLVGFVYGGFRTDSLFNEIVEEPSRRSDYSVQIYETSKDPDNLLYATSNTQEINEKSSTKIATRMFSEFGTTWILEFNFDTSSLVSRSERNAPIYILLVGVVTAFLVFLALLSIFKSRARELQQQKDKEVNLAKDELLSLASHQMRTPATGVKQYMGMVLQGFAGELEPSQKELLEKAYTSNERQLHVINQILHLAKLESGRIVLARHNTDVGALVGDVIEEQQDDIKAHKHTLKKYIPKKPIMLNVDSHMIRMAIENILSNAIKYTIKPGTISVRVKQTKQNVTIIVKDTGIGIDTKQFDKIFQQFARLYDEQTERISGTGIGLYLADQLVRLHKGTLVVDSIVGKGSQFTICLPKSRKNNQ